MFRPEYCDKEVVVCTDISPAYREPERVVCYSLHQVDDNGNTTNLMKGCWSHGDEGCNNSVCRPYYHDDIDVHYCCCQGDMCNLNLGSPLSTPSQGPKTQTTAPPSSSHPPPSVGFESEEFVMTGIAAAVGAVAVIAPTVMVGLWCWSYKLQNKRKKSLTNECC